MTGAKLDINDRLEKGAERIKALEITDQYARKDLEELHSHIKEQDKLLSELLAWKRDCDNTTKVLVRTAMVMSAIATSIGVWIENIKSFVKMVVQWAGH